MEGGHWCPLYYHLLRKKVECLSEIHIKLLNRIVFAQF